MPKNQDTVVMVDRYAFARRHPWLVRGALAVAVAAVIATSPPPTYVYTLRASAAGPAVELSAERPTRRLVLQVRATELAPNGEPTTENVRASLTATLRASGGSAERATFVSAFWSEEGERPRAVSALTSFSLARTLEFTGDCEQPAGGSCESTAVMELERTDAGEHGGVIEVEWSVTLDGDMHKNKGPNQELIPPWEIQVSEE